MAERPGRKSPRSKTRGPPPWWSERARLLDAEAERLGITLTDSVLRERWVTGELWEASTLKRWAALAGGSCPQS